MCAAATVVKSGDDSKALNQRHRPMIISASGIATGGRGLYHLGAFAQVAQVRFHSRVAFPGRHEEDRILLAFHFRHHGLADDRLVVAAWGIQTEYDSMARSHLDGKIQS